MQRDHQQVLSRLQLQQHGPQQSPLRQLEGSPGLLARQPAGHRLLPPALWQPRQIDQPQLEVGPRADHLPRRPVGLGEARAQHLVPPHHLPDALAQRRRVELAAQAQGRRHMVSRAARLQLLDEPQSLLRI